MNFIRHLFPKRRVGLPAAALTVVAGLAFACSESPTEATLDGLAPQFDKRDTGDCDVPVNGHCHDDDPAPDPDPTALTATLTDPVDEFGAPLAGLFSDGDGEAVYAGVNVTDRFKLVPNCADGEGRHMHLQGVVVPGLVNPSTCNDDGQGGGWVFFRLPDLFEIAENCGPEVAANPECFPPIPSFTSNKNGKIRPTGAFAPNAQYFVLDLAGTGQRFSLLLQDGSVDVGADSEGNPTWHFIAHTAHMYIGHQFVCVGDDESEGATADPDLCDDFPLEVNITVTQTL